MSADDFRTVGRPGGEFKVFDELRTRLAEKGLDYDRLPKLSSIDNPPACFVFRGGSLAKGIEDYVSWLRAAAETDDIDYRYDMPGEVNYCHDCTAGFKAQAMAAGACGFHNTEFETIKPGDAEDEEVIGVSRGALVAGYFKYEGMDIREEDLPQFIKNLLDASRREAK